MRYHKHLVSALVECLHDCEKFPVDRVLERKFKLNRKWGARDRRFIATDVFDVVRWKRLLQEMCGHSTDPEDWWLSLLALRERPIPDFCQFDVKAAQRRAESVARQAILLSIPDWLDEWGMSELGSSWPEIMQESNHQAPVFLRPNLLKASADVVRQRLADEGIETDLQDSGLCLRKRANVFVTSAFKQGLFEMQDLNSQKIAPFLDPQPGERVIDACAGAGGKTLHIAALMKNSGKVLALDVHEKKLAELRRRSSRAGCDVIESRLIESSKVVKRLHESCDRLLLDVPCSGTGVLRRHPEQKWRLNWESCQNLKELQRDILIRYSKMVRPGGVLVYSTCSLMPSENRGQIDSFLAQSNDFIFQEDLTLTPEEKGGDGFYMCRLIKRN